MNPSGSTKTPTPHGIDPLLRRHLRIGWWALLVFLSLGTALEVMHGFKVDWLLNVANDTRRMMWRLGHSHGALVGLLNVAFALSLPHLRRGLAYTRLLVPGGCHTPPSGRLPAGWRLDLRRRSGTRNPAGPRRRPDALCGGRILRLAGDALTPLDALLTPALSE